jgi:hypothetical protein
VKFGVLIDRTFDPRDQPPGGQPGQMFLQVGWRILGGRAHDRTFLMGAVAAIGGTATGGSRWPHSADFL